MTATATEIALDQYEGKKVKITKDNDEVIEGKVEATNAESGVLLVKVKGKSSAVLVMRFELKKIETASASDDDITQSVLKPVKLGAVRRHLVNAHGWKLSAVNALVSDEEAFGVHEDLHTGDEARDLGHRHEESAPKSA